MKAAISIVRAYACQIADASLDFGYSNAIRKRLRLAPGLHFRMRTARLPAAS